jgi:integrative and conjugative element protein (TIGR02256 family)
MRWDRGSLLSFRRSARGHQAVALKRWKRSGGTVDWLGEWHSHPEAVPSPSGIDRASWREIAGERAAPMVFLIIGYSGLWLGLSMPGDAVPIRYREAERSASGIGFVPC